MSKPTGINHSALSWVKKELDATLRQAADALETYSEDASDPTHLQFCGSYLHQVHGILQVLELYGATMLVEEMEQVVDALLQGQATQVAEAQQALMQAILQLSDYLERVQGGVKDIPILLLPLLNDLRAVRNVNLLTEHALFAPDLDAVSAEPERPRVSDVPLEEVANTFRPQYQRGLLGLLRGQNRSGSLDLMQGALEAMEGASSDLSVADMWWVASALIDVLQHEPQDSAAAINMLLGQLDREIRHAGEFGEAGLMQRPRPDLLKNMLYYVARSEPHNERISLIQSRYALKSLLYDAEQSDGTRTSLPSLETLQTVAGVLKEDLTTAKDSLDLFARSGFIDHERLPVLTKGLRRVGDTLGVLGLGLPRRVINEQITRIEGFIDGSITADETQVMQIAEGLLYAEAEIGSLGLMRAPDEGDGESVGSQSLQRLAEIEYQQVYGTAVSESVAELALLKDGIVKCIDADNDPDLGEVAHRFQSLASTLRMLDKSHVAELLSKAGDYIADHLGAGRVMPDAREIDALADAIAAVQYYLEAARDGHSHPEHVLERAAHALNSIGYPVDKPAQAAAGIALVGATIQAESPPDVQAAGFEPSPDEGLSGDAGPDVSRPDAGVGMESEPEAPQVETGAEATRKTGRLNLTVPVLAEDVDPEILEIFIEEADEVLETLREEYPRWRNDPDNLEALMTIRRMYHTLKGSGRLAGALLLGEMAWSIESLINRILEQTLPPTPEINVLIEDSIQILPVLIDQLRGETVSDPDVFGLMQRAEVLANPHLNLDQAGIEAKAPVEKESEPEQLQAEPEPAVEQVPNFIDPEVEAGSELYTESDAEPGLSWEPPDVPPQVEEAEIDLGDPAEPVEEASEYQLADQVDDEAPADHVEVQGSDLPEPMDPQLYDIFSRETAEHLAIVNAFVSAGRSSPEPQAASASLMRALHTLTGSARMANVQPIAQIGRKLEMMAEHHVLSGASVGSRGLDLIERGAACVQSVVDNLAAPTAPWPDIEPLLQEMEQATADLAKMIADTEEGVAETVPSEVDFDLAELFVEEAEDILRFMEMTVQRWEDELDHVAMVAELHRSLHTLKGGARLAGFVGIGTLCHVLESVSADVAENKVPADDVFFNLLHAGMDHLIAMIEQARQGRSAEAPTDLLHMVAELRGSKVLVEEVDFDFTDDELIEVFLEEAADILEETEAALNQWQNEPDNAERVLDLQRALHTLKGGARMAGFLPIGDLSHALETLLVSVESGEVPLSVALFELLEQIYDRLFSMREQATLGQALADPADLIDAITRFRDQPQTQQPDPLEVSEQSEETPRLPLHELTESEPEAEHSVPSAGFVEKEPGATADMVRVRADLLDNMVNFAGEVSIYRARLEQQLGGMRFNLNELDQTVTRLRDQLRTLEIETEAQILYRFDRQSETVVADYEDPEQADFDPLELDRFSRMQELSRALSESTNDLVSIQGLLDNLTRESETLLLQQSRVNTELQDGLMRTRMVPFANLVPRMRRIVRQTSQELGRKAQLKVLGARGEMDRTVLERVTSSLEHMLRNAVAHGVEEPSVRRAAGKPEEGTITVALSREGADVVIRVSDDGSGISFEKIRKKAIEEGLMPADAPLSDREITQFILESGFTTTDQVTQIAGRGVGMDVVASEIKQLGGALEIESERLAGTTFTVRLPFTLAVSQALLCQIGEDVYAIPLTSIEGVVRMTHEELEHCFDNPHASYYDYAGERYEVRGLSRLLGVGEPQLPGTGERSPVILVQTGDSRLAIQVDALLGNREIVVKSVGPQISMVPGIYGATILADGRVVLILDISSLIRLHITTSIPLKPAAEPEPGAAQKITVMVVDDSITMRRVATRLLERNGMAVITAKDGVDAVARLQESIPDAMLLDIEMPRMDGYELATHMRNDERLQGVPIIMITSRTSEKHRQRAFEIGVDRYLGKPYQEADLLENLQAVLEGASVEV